MKPLKASGRTNPAKTQPIPRNPKRTGELSEAAFMLKARTLGFNPAKPWGDSERYDFILDTGPRLWRVQLKCTEVLRARGYDVQPITASTAKAKSSTPPTTSTSSPPTSSPSTSGTSC